MAVEIVKFLEHLEEGQAAAGDGWVQFSDGIHCWWKVDVDANIHLIRPHDQTRLNSRFREDLVGERLGSMPGIAC